MWFKVKKPAPVVASEEVVRRHSLRRLAGVFGVPEAALSLDARFGQELKADPASDFKANQFDIVDGDIKDVADKQLLKEMAQGKLVIRTVGDYCEHMVRCSSINPEEVAHSRSSIASDDEVALLQTTQIVVLRKWAGAATSPRVPPLTRAVACVGGKVAESILAAKGRFRQATED